MRKTNHPEPARRAIDRDVTYLADAILVICMVLAANTVVFRSNGVVVIIDTVVAQVVLLPICGTRNRKQKLEFRADTDQNKNNTINKYAPPS